MRNHRARHTVNRIPEDALVIDWRNFVIHDSSVSKKERECNAECQTDCSSSDDVGCAHSEVATGNAVAGGVNAAREPLTWNAIVLRRIRIDDRSSRTFALLIDGISALRRILAWCTNVDRSAGNVVRIGTFKSGLTAARAIGRIESCVRRARDGGAETEKRVAHRRLRRRRRRFGVAFIFNVPYMIAAAVPTIAPPTSHVPQPAGVESSPIAR